MIQVEANKTLAVREGGDVAPGIRLAQVDKGQVVLERNGVRAAFLEAVTAATDAALSDEEGEDA